MSVNLQAWDNFLGRSLIVFLMIEGVKTFPWIARASAGSTAFKLLENVAMNLLLVPIAGLLGAGVAIFLAYLAFLLAILAYVRRPNRARDTQIERELGTRLLARAARAR